MSGLGITVNVQKRIGRVKNVNKKKKTNSTIRKQ